MSNDTSTRVSNLLLHRREKCQPIFDVRLGITTYEDSSDTLLVDYPGNLDGPVPARTALSHQEIDRLKTQGVCSHQVVLVFENGDPRLPIVIGILQDDSSESTTPERDTSEDDQHFTIDVERITFNAKQEITFVCGKGSITLKKTGKIEIRGTDLLSRSRGSNRIKGATVKIN
jgi:hypothetical protein